MDTIITSAGNHTIKHIRKLITSAKARRDSNTFVAEGIHLVQSLRASEIAPLAYVCSESALQNQEINDIKRSLDATHTQYILVTDSVFETMTTIHAPVGILALFSPKALVNSQPLPLNESAVLLEDVQDPGNLGTILRTAVAVGIKSVYLSDGCASPWSPKVLRAGMGAQFGLSVYENATLVNICKAAAVPVFATTLNADSASLYSVDLDGPIAWMFGNEGQGISNTLLTAAQASVYIPQSTGTIESLNVATAAAVCLYEHYRQNSV